MGFIDAFKKKDPNLMKIGSTAWQNQINTQAPEGMHYEFDGDSTYFLIPDKDASIEMRVKVRIPEDLKKIGYSDRNELSELLYRSQRTVEIEEPLILPGGVPISIDEFQKSFDPNIEMKSGKFFIIPEPFREPFEIPIKINNVEYFFKIKQVPFPSLKELRFESSEDGMLFIKLIYNEETKQMKFSLTYNLQKANSVSEIYEKKKLFEDLSKRKVKIFEQETEVLSEDQSNDLKHLLSFYCKLYEIENELDVQFDPKENISPEDVLNTYKTYLSVVTNRYYYDTHKYDSFQITLQEEADFSSRQNFTMLGYNEVNVKILNQSIKMAEQFVFKCIDPNGANKKINKQGEQLELNVKGDKIKYNKLFIKIPEKSNMNTILEELENAININDVE